ncbi:hypothetical protein BJ875DRAFT_505217 [Amylocarpus encephaloides]|uniref:Uncharacterized protein n=1 Tax=Amylocarpus encephaloides TaxID=45428 RepID=A0A9P7YHJ2_9HELO|nr:hypothetical protein BJ875DRAFT_505217 [Amylocarpus encephaloides]
MDKNSQRRRQNEPPNTGSDPRFHVGPNPQGRGFSHPSTDRVRSAPLTASSSAGHGPGRTGTTGTTYSGYYQEPRSSFGAALPTSTMQYPPGYPQVQRQDQDFVTYSSDLMYSVTQQVPQSEVYDSSQEFHTRQPGSMQMLSDMAPPYIPNETNSAPGVQRHASSSSAGVYQQRQESPGYRAPPMPQQGYTGGMTMGSIAQSAQDILKDQHFQRGPGMEEAYASYQTALKEIFQNIINGRLAVAGHSLLEVSEWLLGHVGDLGLTIDEVTLQNDRIRLWGELNTAWLSIFQKQKVMLESGQHIQRPQNLMTQDFINRMAKDLIRLCDAVEKHGLVDYQYGVAEEQIIAILTDCLDVQETIEGRVPQNSALGRPPP